MPVKVLMFGWELPPFNSGGLGVACYGLAKELAGQGVAVTFVLPKKLDIKADFMRIIFADIPDFVWSRLTPYTSSTALTPEALAHLPPGMLEGVLAYAHAAARIAKKADYDLVHAHDWLCFPAGIAAAQSIGRPLVAHVHATEFDRSGGLSVNPSIYTIEKKGMDKAAKVIALSRFMKDLLVRHYRADPAKISVVHNGITPDEFSPVGQSDPLAPIKAAGFKIVTYIGRLTLQKGVDYFIRAAQMVLKYNPRVAFLIVGSGDMEGQLISQVASLGISDHVLFAGFLRGNLLKSVYQSSDLFVMPSVSEPFGLTALESVASGTPALISKQSGVSETLTHALKVDFWDVEEMANQMLSVLEYSSLHSALRQNGLEEISKNTWASAAAKTIRVYNEVLTGKH